MIPQNVNLGLICRNVRTSGFKLALVVGYPSTACAKLRVCFWRAASARWTQPALVDVVALRMLDEADYNKQRAVIARAVYTAIDLNLVARVWS